METSAGLAAHLNTMKERLQQERFSGQSNGKFQRMSVEGWLKLSKSQAINVINYGLEHGVLEKAGRYDYQFARQDSGRLLGPQS
jgi:Fic family protein